MIFFHPYSLSITLHNSSFTLNPSSFSLKEEVRVCQNLRIHKEEVQYKIHFNIVPAFTKTSPSSVQGVAQIKHSDHRLRKLCTETQGGLSGSGKVWRYKRTRYMVVIVTRKVNKF